MKSVTQFLVASALAFSATMAHAAKGDVEVKTITKSTGNQLVLEVGECRLLPQTDQSGSTYFEVEVKYAVCEEYVTYEVDETDLGWWQYEQSNPRNQRVSVKTSIESFSESNYMRKTNLGVDSQDDMTNILVDLGSAGIDGVKLMANCEAQRKGLLMQARTQNQALAQACGQ